MTENKLLENLNRLGFPLLEVTTDFDANKTLAEVVQSRDARLWEGFPVLLVNAVQDYSVDYDGVLHELTEGPDHANFHALVLLSLAMYQYHHLSFHWANQLKKRLTDQDMRRLREMRNALVHEQPMELGQALFDPARLKRMFNRYFEQNTAKARQLKEKHGELSLEYALSQVFSPKQKELFKKKLEGQPFNKTEKEYYSRTVRKKVSALANPELHRLAQKLLDY
ncbi:MAG: hypothetical protein A2521_02855 [Deltaproteobacteria bacterium RIFOXYD12_FULL_57_12]|nr:MAG: hypothetical protein A2521_02855 [Deltaproteobacteria bacterium RIFOXYD12_FULL_57_12]